MAEFNSPFSPFGGTQPEEELLYPEQGMQFGGTGGSLFGAQPTDGGVDPTALAGLGLGGGIVAAGTGGQAATSQVLSPFAQKVAAQDAARLAAQNRPALIGGPTTTQGVLTGPNTPAQYTGTAQGRPVPGTQLAPQGQPPSVRATGGAPAVRGTSGAPMKIAQKVGTAAKASRFASPGSIAYTLADLGTAALTGEGITERIVNPIAGSLAELYYGDGNLPAFSPEELAQIQQGSVAQDPNLPQMSRLGDEPLTFTAPTGPSSTATQSAQLAATLPDDSGLMGAPGIQETGIPTTTLNIDGGSVTVPQALADQTFRGIGAAPMSIEETRARLGGRTLNEYLSAPSGTEGVSGLRTDPQGRMIPAGFETRADAYGDYERESAAREGRLAASMQQPGETTTERDTRAAGERTTGPRTYGGYTTAQLRGMVGGGDALRAAQMRAEAGLNPLTGNREKTEGERAQSFEQDQLQNELLQARLDSFKQTEPGKLSIAESDADQLGLTGKDRQIFIIGKVAGPGVVDRILGKVPTDTKVPTSIIEAKEQRSQLAEARKLFTEGKIPEAADILASIGMINKLTGFPIEPAEYFKPVAPDPPAEGTEPAEPIADVIARNL